MRATLLTLSRRFTWSIQRLNEQRMCSTQLWPKSQMFRLAIIISIGFLLSIAGSVPQVHGQASEKKPTAVNSLAYAPDGSWLAVIRGKDVHVLEAATLASRQILRGAEYRLNSVAIHPNGNLIAAAGGEPGSQGEIAVWNLANRETRRWEGHSDAIYSIAFSPDGGKVVTGSYDRNLKLWNVSAGNEESTLKHHTGPVNSSVFSPNGSAILSGASDQTVKLWNSGTGERILTLSEATKAIHAVAFHPQGKELTAAGVDRTIRVYEWNGTTARLKRSTLAHDGPILVLAYSPDGSTLYSGSEDLRLKAWDVANLRERHVYPGLSDWPTAISVERTGKFVACGLIDGTVLILDSQSPQIARQLASQGASIPLRNLSVASYVSQTVIAGVPQEGVAAKPNPPAPRLDSIGPRSTVRGETVKLTLSGQNIADADELFVAPGHLVHRLLPADPKNANQRLCEVELPADFEPGMISLRLHTPLGSTAARSVYVGPYHEKAEVEPNQKTAEATPVEFPATLTGAIASRGDRDVWSFSAEAGDEIVFYQVGANMGSALQARLTIRHAETGNVVASEVRRTGRAEVIVGFQVPQSGKYALEVQDRDNAGSGNHFYWIHAGRLRVVTSWSPWGLQSIEEGAQPAVEHAMIQVKGFNIRDANPILASAAKGTQSRPIQIGSERSIKSIRWESSAHPELVENEPNDRVEVAALLPIPSAVSGQIALAPERGDVDVFGFEAKQGSPLTLEVIARRWGSPLDSVLEILDSHGVVLPRHTLRSVAETYTELRDHDSRSKGIRLHNWEDLIPGDLVMLGGELAKVQIMPLGPDEDVKFYDRSGVRAGYLGTTPEAHALNRFAYKVEVHPAGSTFPPNGMPVVQLPWKNDDGGPAFQTDSVIYFDPPADGKYWIRVRDVRNQGGDDFQYRLVIRPRRPDFRVSIDPENPNIPRGGALPINVNIERLDDFNGAVDVTIEGLPVGFSASSTTIGPDLQTGVIQIASRIDTPELTPGQSKSWRVVANARIASGEIVRDSSPAFGHHQLSITSPPDLAVKVEPELAEIRPGEEVKFTVTIERRNGFAGRVPVDVLNLPFGLRVLDVGLNGVLINETETSRSFVVTCDPWAPTGKWPFFAAPKVEAKNERFGSQVLLLEVKK